jgi:hypothetical protein
VESRVWTTTKVVAAVFRRINAHFQSLLREREREEEREGEREREERLEDRDRYTASRDDSCRARFDKGKKLSRLTTNFAHIVDYVD